MMSPSGWKHGRIVGRLHGLLWNYVSHHNLGEVFGAETGFWICRNPDTVRAPEVVLSGDDFLEGEDVVPGFQCKLSEVFRPLD